jgi:hypothetical protein
MVINNLSLGLATFGTVARVVVQEIFENNP